MLSHCAISAAAQSNETAAELDQSPGLGGTRGALSLALMQVLEGQFRDKLRDLCWTELWTALGAQLRQLGAHQNPDLALGRSVPMAIRDRGRSSLPIRAYRRQDSYRAHLRPCYELAKRGLPLAHAGEYLAGRSHFLCRRTCGRQRRARPAGYRLDCRTPAAGSPPGPLTRVCGPLLRHPVDNRAPQYELRRHRRFIFRPATAPVSYSPPQP